MSLTNLVSEFIVELVRKNLGEQSENNPTGGSDLWVIDGPNTCVYNESTVHDIISLDQGIDFIKKYYNGKTFTVVDVNISSHAFTYMIHITINT